MTRCTHLFVAVNVNKVKNFEEVKKQEMAMERMRMENIKRMTSTENKGDIPVSLFTVAQRFLTCLCYGSMRVLPSLINKISIMCPPNKYWTETSAFLFLIHLCMLNKTFLTNGVDSLRRYIQSGNAVLVIVRAQCVHVVIC